MTPAKRKKKDEHRQYFRLHTVFPVEFMVMPKGKSEFGAELYQAFTSDIGPGGMCLHFKDIRKDMNPGLAKGTRLMLFINLPIRAHPFEATAEVAWVRQQKTPGHDREEYALGIRYLCIHDADDMAILAYARRLHRRPYLRAAALLSMFMLAVWSGTLLVANRYKALALVQQLTSATSQLQEMEQEKKATEEKLDRLMNERMANEKNISDLEKRIDKYRGEVTRLEDEQVTSKYQAYRSEYERTELLRKIEQSQQGKAALEALVMSLKKELGNLQSELVYRSRYQPVPEALSRQTLKSELERRNRQQRLKQIEDEKDKLEEILIQLQQEVNSIQSEIDHYKSESGDDDLERRLSTMRRRRKTTESYLLSSAQSDIQAALSGISRNNNCAAIGPDEKKNDKNAEKRRQLLKRIEELEASKDGLANIIDALKKQLDSLKGELAQYKTMAEQEARQRKSAEKDKSGLTTLIETMKSDLTLLRRQLLEKERVSAPPRPAPAQSPQPQPSIIKVLQEELENLKEKLRRESEARVAAAPRYTPPMPSRDRGPEIEVLDADKLRKLENAAALDSSDLKDYMFAPSEVVSRDSAENGCFFGLFPGPGKISENNIRSIERLVGKKTAQIVFYSDWSRDFPAKQCETISGCGAVPHIVWEPRYWNKKEDVTLADIAEGRWDGYIEEWARAAAAAKIPLFLRWGHEFNGNWYPWATARNNKSPQDYIRAYRRVHDIFARCGAHNVIWIWCMNNLDIPNKRWNNPFKAYPGDAYVDWIGIDGYNFGKGEAWCKWQSFDEIFRQKYGIIASKWTKPIMICEFASAEYGGRKDKWIRNCDTYLKHGYNRIKAICWFNENKEKNWTLWSGRKTLLALQQIFSDDFYLCSGARMARLHRQEDAAGDS